MKKLTLIIGLLVAGNVLFAQEGREQRERPPVKIEKYKERLQLTDTQIADLKKVRESLKPELEALRNDDSKSRSERMHAHADILKKQEDQVAEILNDDQEAELKVIQTEVRDRVKAKRERRRERRKG